MFVILVKLKIGNFQYVFVEGNIKIIEVEMVNL